jgi:hypothetical protein
MSSPAIGPSGADESTLHSAADEARRARTRIVEIAVTPFAITSCRWQTGAKAIIAAAQPAAASAIPATATALIGAAAKVVCLPDVVAGERGVGRYALRAILTRITRTRDIKAAIDVDVGAIAVDTSGRSTAGGVEPAATALVGTTAVITGNSHEITGEGRICANANGAIPAALTRPSVVLDKAAESIDASRVAAACLIEATAAPHVGAAIEWAVQREPVVGTDERGVGGQALAAIEAGIARTETGVMGRSATTRRPPQGEESCSGAGQHAEAVPPRESDS